MTGSGTSTTDPAGDPSRRSEGIHDTTVETDERTPEEFDDDITNALEFPAGPRRRGLRRERGRVRQDLRRGRPAHASVRGLPDRRLGRPPPGTSAESPERFSVVAYAGVRFDDGYVVVRLPTGGFCAFNADFRSPEVINPLAIARVRLATPSRSLARNLGNGDDRDRTGNLLLAKQALSQLSYVPEGSFPPLFSSSMESDGPIGQESSISLHTISRHV